MKLLILIFAGLALIGCKKVEETTVNVENTTVIKCSTKPKKDHRHDADEGEILPPPTPVTIVVLVDEELPNVYECDELVVEPNEAL